MTEPSIRVLLVDDQELVRAGFRTIMSIDARIDVVGEAGTGVEAVAAARELNPDVICLDVQMPDMDGIEATRIITADPSVTSAVLILTTFNRDDYLFSALAAGASGFMLKNSSPEQLIAAIVSVASGDALLSPQVTRSVIERFAQTEAGAATDGGDSDGGGLAGTVLAGTVHAGTVLAGEAVAQPEPTSAIPEPDDAPHLQLTERELEVLKLVAQGLSNLEIAGELFVSEATIKTHVSNLLRKLSLRDRIQAVIYAYEYGVL
ncbi:response regulator [Lysinibacter cavernae]|uniref:DNA-binding NarL/FixJ family response regulator n=1 Tax=Lysinibacter cavernae TaxID=1640652 RepID=A0A7X5R2S2_9MICO|nr:response regulator transcription factor [Lysinibacter cavernae]NIH54506.1 DNA-binding NarL/FixJ family response regulator [Lysinibacter cavernae]